jgi:23S rRNA (adenine2030-N6)-methyltransferase
MLSYQHSYHAGSAADVHKHALIASLLDQMAAKDKPLSYFETHAGRGLYDLSAPEAVKTGEAAQGIRRAEAAGWFPPAHPYAAALESVRALHGQGAYPGSPLLAVHLLRPADRLALAELHPQEFATLSALMAPLGARCVQQDGFAQAQALLPPTPRRGVLLIDPSYEVKADYAEIPGRIAALHRKWNVGVIALWYPILSGGDAPHAPMLAVLEEAGYPRALRHEVGFAPARPGNRMIGSGMFILNAPFGLADEAARLTKLFAA